jgi:hypothetical protein
LQVANFLLDTSQYKLTCDASDEGEENLKYLMDSLEVVQYSAEYPMDSVHAFDIAAARAGGMVPDDIVFSTILNKYFPMTLPEFLSDGIPRETFRNFERECLKNCAALVVEQVQDAYEQTMYLLDCFDCLESPSSSVC